MRVDGDACRVILGGDILYIGRTRSVSLLLIHVKGVINNIDNFLAPNITLNLMNVLAKYPSTGENVSISSIDYYSFYELYEEIRFSD